MFGYVEGIAAGLEFEDYVKSAKSTHTIVGFVSMSKFCYK